MVNFLRNHENYCFKWYIFLDHRIGHYLAFKEIYISDTMNSCLVPQGSLRSFSLALHTHEAPIQGGGFAHTYIYAYTHSFFSYRYEEVFC